jgi:hypothetical protein
MKIKEIRRLILLQSIKAVVGKEERENKHYSRNKEAVFIFSVLTSTHLLHDCQKLHGIAQQRLSSSPTITFNNLSTRNTYAVNMKVILLLYSDYNTPSMLYML